jgi:hypothetical protein
MSISEESRHRLYTRLEQVLGTADASTLMEHLPPVGWADVATKRDLDNAVALLRGEMAKLGSELLGEIARATTDTRASIRSLFLGLVGLQVSGAGLVLAVARLS